MADNFIELPDDSTFPRTAKPREIQEGNEEIVGGIRSLRELLDHVTGRELKELPAEESGLAEVLPFPFLAMVGQLEMKLALLISLINPAIGGVLLVGPRGTGKTTAIRGLVELLPEVPRSLCYYGCMPEDIEAGGIDAVCPACAHKFAQGEPLAAMDKVRLVELPLNAKLDDVLGHSEGSNEGTRYPVFRKGILAQADRNLLHIDEVNLLADEVIDAILDAAAQGVYRIRRGNIADAGPAGGDRCPLDAVCGARIADGAHPAEDRAGAGRRRRQGRGPCGRAQGAGGNAHPRRFRGGHQHGVHHRRALCLRHESAGDRAGNPENRLEGCVHRRTQPRGSLVPPQTGRPALRLQGQTRFQRGQAQIAAGLRPWPEVRSAAESPDRTGEPDQGFRPASRPLSRRRDRPGNRQGGGPEIRQPRPVAAREHGRSRGFRSGRDRRQATGGWRHQQQRTRQRGEGDGRGYRDRVGSGQRHAHTGTDYLGPERGRTDDQLPVRTQFPGTTQEPGPTGCPHHLQAGRDRRRQLRPH